MHVNKIIGAYFSPTHHSEKYINQSLAMLPYEKELINLTNIENRQKNYSLKQDEMLVLCLPVYAGRIPKLTEDYLKCFKGHQSPAIIFVCYGNRYYDDALMELKNRLIEQGFIIQGAGALIGEHTYTPKLGTLRPRGEDIVEVRDFIYSILQEDFKTASIEVPGNNSYRPYKTNEVVPYCLEHCIKCGKCIRVCPIQAISKDYVTDVNCLVCNKCVKECPMNARVLPSDFEDNIKAWLESQFRDRKENQFFR